MPAALSQRWGWLLQALILGVAIWSLSRMHADASQIPLTTVVQSWHLILAALALSLGNYAIRALRWRAYLADLRDPLPLGNSALAYLAGFAFALSPGKVGEMARARYCAPFRVTVVNIAATLVAERFQDAVAMMLLALLALTAGSRYTPAVLGAGILVAVAAVVLALVPWEPLADRLKSTKRLAAMLRTPVAAAARSLAAARALFRPGMLVWGLVAGLIAWAMEGLGFAVLGSMLPVSVPVLASIGIYSLAVLIGSMTFLPGGLGSTEAVMTALLVERGCALSGALLVTLLCRAATLWFGMGLGWLAIVVLRRVALSAGQD